MISFIHSEKNINLPARFVIPSYQRGYRWHQEDAKKLLQDLLNHTGNVYCLQPIELQTLSKDKDLSEWLKKDFKNYEYYRVVDGQQRLTTISIIAHVLNCSLEWDICYDTEEKLLSELIPCTSESTINNYFRKRVYEKADTFIKSLEITYKEVLFAYFGKCQVRQIVFPIHFLTNDPNDPEGQKAFARLNAGKTPLTSSELIRALYMVNDNDLTDDQRIEIAKEWELIESTLQNEQYWLMFNTTKSMAETPTRIDLLFALVLQGSSKLNWNSIRPNPRSIFETMETGYYDKEIDLLKVWHEVMRCFWWIQSCYEDIETYNYLGWIALCTENQPSTIYQAFLNAPATDDFKKTLIGIIHNNGVCDTEQRYGNPNLKNLFLLFNILECNNCKERFRFDLLETYDVEHVDSQTPNDLTKPNDRYEWLNSVWSEYPGSHEIIRKIMKCTDDNDFTDSKLKDFCQREFKEDFLNELKGKIQQIHIQKGEENIPDEHDLGNLALLNSNINRSYKNAVFPGKRKKIIEAYKEGTQYIPPCTLKLFMKFYTQEASSITEWLKRDFDSYKTQMNKLLQKFVEKKSESPKTEKKSESPKTEKNLGVSPTLDKSKEQCEENVLVYEQKKITGEISFPDLMDNYSIRIPKIQRLYVQGRQDSYGKKCLHDFASGLVKSVTEHTLFPLDMIYGIATDKVFFPLDGQQRITTLLLLAWLCGKVTDKWSLDYESRRATEIFVEKLLKTPTPPLSIKSNTSEEEKYPPVCTEYIEKQDWFLGIWKQDPGIAGMMEMLDSLYDKLAKGKKGDYSFDQIKFTINYLDVSDKSYNHIFLKMNSRGRQLTPWENIKAVLDQYAPKPDSALNWKNSIDFVWPENLWTCFDFKQNITDLDDCMTDIIELAAKHIGYDGKIEDVFTFNEWLARKDNVENVKKFFNFAEILFSATIECKEKSQALTPIWGNIPCEPNFKRRDSIFLKNLVAYFAASFSSNSDWMRVVWNIVENGEINRNNFSSACALIEELSMHKNDILAFLSSESSCAIKSKFANEQLQEEREKAKRIMGWLGNHGWVDGAWYSRIKNAEKYAFFNGAIRFLFITSEDGKIDWKDFDSKFKNATRYFDKDGVGKEYRKNALLLRAFLAKKKNINDAFWFGNGKDFWRNNVLLKKEHYEIMSELLTLNSLEDESYINGIDGVADWIKDKTLISDAISGDNDPNGKWHILSDWRNANVLTRYSRRESGNVNYPWQIIPIASVSTENNNFPHKKLNDLLKNKLDKNQLKRPSKKRGEKYFIGWENTPIEFEYGGTWFRYYGEHGEDAFDVYLLKDGGYTEEERPGSQKDQPDKDRFYCFNVKDSEDFSTELEGLKKNLMDDMKKNQE